MIQQLKDSLGFPPPITEKEVLDALDCETFCSIETIQAIIDQNRRQIGARTSKDGNFLVALLANVPYQIYEILLDLELAGSVEAKEERDLNPGEEEYRYDPRTVAIFNGGRYLYRKTRK